MKIFEHVLIRMSALPHESLLIPANQVITTVDTLNLANEDLVLYKNEASSLLLEFNRTLEDRKVQQIIQNIRKKIFQLKRLSQSELDLVKSLPDFLQLVVIKYNGKLDDLERLNELYRQEYGKILVIERRNLQQLSFNNALLKGISLSSHHLYRDLSKYQSKDVQGFKSDEYSTERALFKYATRMACKTSPFSTFTHIGAARLKKFKGQQLFPIQNQGVITLNKNYRISAFLVNQIKNKILSDIGLALQIPVRVNRTLQRKKKELTFVTYQNFSHKLTRVCYDKGISLVLDIMENKSLSIDEIASKIIAETQQDKKEIVDYLLALARAGVIEVELDIDLLKPDWASSLLQTFKKNINAQPPPVKEHLVALETLLFDINQLLTHFPNADALERVRGLQDIQAKVHYYLNGALGITPAEAVTQGKLAVPEKLIYEDIGFEGGILLDKGYASTFGRKILLLFKALQITNAKNSPEKKVFNYFETKFPKRSEVPFLDFYENYFKDVLQPEYESQTTKTQSISLFKNNLIEDKELLAKWKEGFLRRLSPDASSTEINLNLDIIERTNSELNIKEVPTHLSLGLFIQTAYDRSAERHVTVVNSMYGSFGKMFSRFLPVLSKKVKKDLKAFIYKRLDQAGLPVEINDSSPNNANIYPSILDHELKLPGGRASHRLNRQIQLSDISIRKNRKNKRLYLYEKSRKKRIFPIDFGFQNPETRLELFQFIGLFSPIEGISHAFLVETLNGFLNKKRSSGNTEYIILPRIVYEDDIILQRKTWVISPASLPLKQTNEDDQSYFQRTRSWRENLDIPSQVFIRRRKSDVQQGNDNYKPQYINFNSPLNILQFGRIINKNKEKDLIIQEALPAYPDMVTIKGQHFASEMFIQIGD